MTGTYDAGLVALSYAIAIVTSIVALWIAFHLRSESITNVLAKRVGAALVMGVAVVGMHYTGMAAANFAPDSVCAGVQEISNAWLVTTIAVCTVLFLVGTVLIPGREKAVAGQQRSTSIGMRIAFAFITMSVMVAYFAAGVLKIQISTSGGAAL